MLHKFTNQATDMLVGSQVAPAQGRDPGRPPKLSAQLNTSANPHLLWEVL